MVGIFMVDDLINKMIHKEQLQEKVQDLIYVCSNQNIGGSKYVSKLDKLLFEDIKNSTNDIQENLL